MGPCRGPWLWFYPTLLRHSYSYHAFAFASSYWVGAVRLDCFLSVVVSRTPGDCHCVKKGFMVTSSQMWLSFHTSYLQGSAVSLCTSFNFSLFLIVSPTPRTLDVRKSRLRILISTLRPKLPLASTCAVNSPARRLPLFPTRTTTQR